MQQLGFRMQAAPDVAGRAVLGAVEVRTGPLLVGQIPLSIRVRSADEPQDRAEAIATATARIFDSVFASYAHKDARVVRAFAEAYRALGINVLIDKASLRAGEDWQEALLWLIQEADLFQLFWSEAASRSRYVTQEWRHALSLQDHKGERFIRPLYWRSPWPQPPAQLAHLHFAHLDLLALSSVTERSSSQAGSPYMR
jgi:TIR domain